MSTTSSLQAVTKDSDILRDPQNETVGTDAFEYSRHLTNQYMSANWTRPTSDCTLPTDSLGPWVRRTQNHKDLRFAANSK